MSECFQETLNVDSTSFIPVFTMALTLRSGVVFIKLLGRASCLGENFKFIFMIYFQLYFNILFMLMKKKYEKFH